MEKSNPHIEEYFLKNDNNSKAYASKELFKDDNIELRTDLIDEEIIIINKLMYNDAYLKKLGLEPVFKLAIENFMKLKVSKDRQSRKEFVSINKDDKTDEMMSGFGNIANIMGVRK